MAGRSTLVVCHPDDEILWFSSIIEEVDKIIVCLLEAPQFPNLIPGRLKVIQQYPLKNIVWLQVRGSQSAGKADWGKISASEFGVELPQHENPEDYARSFREIQGRLAVELQGYSQVYTHNPWGEYGHEEHVQVYRAVESLKDKLGFEVCFSNYCSNVSFEFMLRHIRGFRSNYQRRSTNLDLSAQVKKLYQEHGCWTWFDDWQPFQDECFMNLMDLPKPALSGHGHLFPLNMIRQER